MPLQHQRELLRWSSSSSSLALGLSSICRPPATMLRLSTPCDAGRRPSTAARQQQFSSRNVPRQQHSHTSRDGAPVPLDNKTLDATISSSIMQVHVHSATAPQELTSIVSQYGNSFSAVHTAAAFVKAAKLRGLQPAAAGPLLDALAGIWGLCLPDAEPRQLANVLWACGKLRYANPQLWSSTLFVYTQVLQHSELQIPCQELSSALYGLAAVAAANRGVVPGFSWFAAEDAVCLIVRRVCACVTQQLPQGVSPQAISNTLWACAKLRLNPGDAALDSLLQAMGQPAMLQEAAPQALANTLWAASELQRRCSWQPGVEQQVWQRLLGEQQLLSIADRGTSIEVSNTVLAVMRLSTAAAGADAAAAGLASAVIISKEFAQQCALQLLQGKVAQQLQLWSPQAISNSMFAFAQLRVCDATFMSGASALAHKWLPGAAATGVEQVAYACKALHFRDHRMMAAVIKRGKQLLQQRGKGQMHERALRCKLAAQVGYAVAALDMRQLAGDVRELVVSSGVAEEHDMDSSFAFDAGYGSPHSSSGLAGSLGMLWEVHAWLLQHQLLDGQGLAGLLSQQQLEEGRAASEKYHAQQQQQQQK
uniref:FAST kinase leucine-rich domain-containing protein n=1 Tax=Tetradesmus obliquus TaxID=3088 RepID=A0A383WIE2_TETOB|eukprot:jgi/Sobl393_1/1361/SZX59834.1